MGNATSTREGSLADVSFPKWIFLQLLEHCNLRCRMCYEWGENGAYHEKKALRRLDIKAVRRVIDDCSPARPYYDLYGGEPLLYPHLEEVLQAIKQAGSEAQLPTNGTLLEEYADLLVEASVDRIWVSLDGPPEINDRQRGAGVFSRALRGIDKVHRLREQRGLGGPRIGVTLTVTPANHRHIETFVTDHLDLAKVECLSIELQSYLTEQDCRSYEAVLRAEFGVTGAPVARGFLNDPAIFSQMDVALLAEQVEKVGARCRSRGVQLNTSPKVMSEDNIRKYLSAEWLSMSERKRRCSFPWISTEISARGDVTSCHAFYDLSLGNVYEASVVDIWRGERYMRYRKYLRKSLLPICQSCCLFYEESRELQRSKVSCNQKTN